MKQLTDKEILDFAKKNLSIIRTSYGTLQLFRVKCDVDYVDGYVSYVDGDVDYVYGYVNAVGGNVNTVGGETKQGE